MPKKTYSIRLDEDLMARLEIILDAKGVSKGLFIEDYLITFINHIEKSSTKITAKKCPDCKKYQGKFVNCSCKKVLA
jgi:predicted DNA-binding protein